MSQNGYGLQSTTLETKDQSIDDLVAGWLEPPGKMAPRLKSEELLYIISASPLLPGEASPFDCTPQAFALGVVCGKTAPGATLA